MEIGNELYISRHYKRSDYLGLGLDVKSPIGKWRKAVLIFNDRICGRYFNPIKDLIEDKKIYDNGFAAMSLMCLLIDTFYQFENGVENTKYTNQENYTSFMQNSLGFGDKESTFFYHNIRCGLLHSAETLNGSYLVSDKIDGSLIAKFDSKYQRYGLAVSIRGMYDLLKSYFNDYCNALLSPSDDRGWKLRSNFISKMNYITSDRHKKIFRSMDMNR